MSDCVVRFGSIADICNAPTHVCFTPPQKRASDGGSVRQRVQGTLRRYASESPVVNRCRSRGLRIFDFYPNYSLGRRLRSAKSKSPCSCRPVRKRQLGACNVWRDPEMSGCLPDLSPAVTANSETSVPSVARKHSPDRSRSAGSRFSIWEYVPSLRSHVVIYISVQAMVLAVPAWTLAVLTLFPGP